MLKNLYLLVSSLLIAAPLFAQSYPAAEGGRVAVRVGAEVSAFNPDYGCSNNSPFACGSAMLFGAGPYADVDHLWFRRLGAAGEGHFLVRNGQKQYSYLAGPRIVVLNHRKLALNGKFLIGVTHLSLPPRSLGAGNYLTYAPGATLDYRLSPRLSARVDYEYQIWPNFVGSGTGQGGLTPNGFSVGMSYTLRR